MNKKNIFLIIGVFWIVLIAGFIGIKEFTLRTGTEVLLKTLPVDPRDLFRGDYVVLRYEVSTINENTFLPNASAFKVGDSVYVLLDIGSDKIAKAKSISKQIPEDSYFMKGTVKNVFGNKLNIEYGIESYFVPEGKGREIEKNIGNIYAKIAIDKFGNAVIKSLVLDGKEIDLN
ncbi:MAG TPA: GDYXXLXY domain-containing protein [Candidatus Moranbacteria bacterium]|nr:GDYXXLXY domain-containing protein [Candidatus Moranbacteria bacterium]HRZ33861.1 GDYXXLXY domain-containing protein [Candidatus Moranbacteria bacterium]